MLTVFTPSLNGYRKIKRQGENEMYYETELVSLLSLLV